MDTGERLAAYLAGDLDTERARALEAELAGDPSLRARLARMRRLEEQLGAMPSVEPPAEFSDRLASALREELRQRPLPGDELGARRERRRRATSWLPAAAAAAAVVAVVVGVSTGLPGGGEDSGDEGGMTTMEAPGDAGGEDAARSADGPVVVDQGRSYDSESIQALAADDRFAGILDQRLSGAPASEVAQEYRQQLGATSDGQATGGRDTAADSADAPDEAAEEAATTAEEDDGFAAVGRCLDQLLVGEEALIPVYAELATFEGEDAIVYGIVSRERDGESFTRMEIWVVERGTCEVLFFTQEDR